jgi:subtilisin family serine protease
MIPVIIVMSEQLDQEFLYRHACELDKSDRRQWVISELKTLAQRTQQGLLSYLRTEKGTGKADRIHSLWIANAISAEVTKDIIHKLSSMPEIYQIFYDDDCFHILGKPSEASERALSKDIVWGVQKIRADQVWAAGYTGDGIIIGHIDTGVNYNHTDLIDHMWDGGEAYPHHGIDICNFDNDPIDDNGHGTHTAGTIAGDGTSGTQTGVAPDARIMALKALDADGNADCHRIGWSIQFALDHGADFVSISGGFSNPNDALKNYFRGVCDNAFAADLPLAVAAGNGDNAGGHYPVPHDINTPADVPAPWYGSAGHTAAMAVGMTNSSDVIDSWSSYGPTEWNTATYTDYPYPPGLMKPDVSAPGVNIVSLKHDNNTGYTGGWDGTSMACPHLAGTIALMLEKNPLLTCIEIDSIIENFGVVDLGTPGRDNYYGAGRIDAYNAVAAVPTTTAKKGDFYIHNDIPVGVSLKVSDITWSASWIKAVSPAKPETWKGDSTGIEVYVDSTGLAPGMYWDTLWIYSNDPDENPYPEPVCLITTIIGIEETEKTTQVPVASGLCHIFCPNPFSKSTVISYSSLVINDQLPVTNDLQYPVLRIYDVSGRIVKVFNLTSDLLLPASVISWDAKDDKGRKVPAGVYFVRLFVANPVGETRGFKQTHKVVLLH